MIVIHGFVTFCRFKSVVPCLVQLLLSHNARLVLVFGLFSIFHAVAFFKSTPKVLVYCTCLVTDGHLDHC